MAKEQTLIDDAVKMDHNRPNITATLSTLRVSRNLGGFSLPATNPTQGNEASKWR
ncbi:hypothetical protein GCM10011357_27460 [Lacimicrobium alkaliphilum]|uniref:Uncharacterized protein n=1 Tax=Lacimicrobium alkaliphilum TaxID=1526571 RepID=A0ABQ1RK36_9ALTE|nr:hypothetical protein GCM10011357_27460 [Lacimicrobium alkaliphilum]